MMIVAAVDYLAESTNRYPPEVRAHLASFAMPIADLGYTSTHFIDIIEAALIEQQHDDDDDGHTANPKWATSSSSYSYIMFIIIMP